MTLRQLSGGLIIQRSRSSAPVRGNKMINLRRYRFILVMVVLTFGLGSVQAEEEAASTQAAAKQLNPNELFDQLVNAKDWRERDSAAKQLADSGRRGIDLLRQGAEKNENATVRRTCFETLSHSIEKYPWLGETLARYGLKDSDNEIRYICAFSLGTNKVWSSHRSLRSLMDDKTADDRTRLTAAKSLAELGEPDVIARLYKALSGDFFMDRHIA